MIVASFWNSDLSIHGNSIFAPYSGDGSWLWWLCMWALYEFVTANPQDVFSVFSLPVDKNTDVKYCDFYQLSYRIKSYASRLN